MIFNLQANFSKEEKTILINAHNVIHQMIEEMECTGIETYQDSDIEEWRFIKNKIKDLVT
jgi:hypothetical protein